jgi:hypothetical protein
MTINVAPEKHFIIDFNPTNSISSLPAVFLESVIFSAVWS